MQAWGGYKSLHSLPFQRGKNILRRVAVTIRQPIPLIRHVPCQSLTAMEVIEKGPSLQKSGQHVSQAKTDKRVSPEKGAQMLAWAVLRSSS